MTYRQLLKKCQQVPDNRLDDDVMVFDKESEEYRPVTHVEQAGEENDVLDEGHLVLVT